MADARVYPDQTATPTWLVDQFGNRLGTQSNPLQIAGSFAPAANQRVNAQSGDFVANSITDLATLLALAGTSGDANSVNSLMGRLTKIRDLLNTFGLDNTDRQKVSLYGKNAANADTPVFLDTTGRVVTTEQVRNAILNGTMWSATTGMVSAAVTEAFQWLVTNANTKNILIVSVRLVYTNANQYAQLQYLTASDATIAAGTAVSSALNMKGGGGSPASTWSMAYNTAGAATGTALDFVNLSLNGTVECLPQGTFLYIPSATAGGVAAYCNTTAAGKWSATIKWIEF